MSAREEWPGLTEREYWLIQLDNLVSEHVFGCKWVTCLRSISGFERGRSYLRSEYSADALVQQHPEEFEHGKNDDPIHGHQSPQYSRSISDAWKLLEAMEAEGWTWFANHNANDAGPYSFIIARGTDFGDARAGTPALSITLASLRAVGCEIPEEPTDG